MLKLVIIKKNKSETNMNLKNISSNKMARLYLDGNQKISLQMIEDKCNEERINLLVKKISFNTNKFKPIAIVLAHVYVLLMSIICA